MAMVAGIMLLGLELLPVAAEFLAVRQREVVYQMNWLAGLVIVLLVLLNGATGLNFMQSQTVSFRQSFQGVMAIVIAALQRSESGTNAPTAPEDSGTTPDGAAPTP